MQGPHSETPIINAPLLKAAFRVRALMRFHVGLLPFFCDISSACQRQRIINTGVKRKKRSELGIGLSLPSHFEAWEKTGDRIKDGVRNGIKDEERRGGDRRRGI